MTFPIDFDEHPKVEPLSDAAFRTFVAMNGYSRRQKLDGRIPAVVARKRWKVRALTELLDSHPERPLLLLDGNTYVLREYAEHQFTTQDEADLHEKRSKAGALGGKAKAAAVASARQMQQQNVAESESGIEPDTGTTTPVALDPNVREFTAEEIVGFRSALNDFGAAGLSDLALVTLVMLLVEAAPRPVANVVGYVVRCTQRSPQKVRKLAVEAERQASRVPSLDALERSLEVA